MFKITREIGIMIFIAVLATFGAVYYVFYPRYVEFQKITTDINKKNRDLKNAYKSIEGIDEVKKNHAIVVKRLALMDSKINKGKQTDVMLAQMATLAKKCGIGFVSIKPIGVSKPSDPIRAELYSSLMFEVEFECDYLSLINFLKNTRMIEKFSDISSLSIKAPEEKKGEGIQLPNTYVKMNVHAFAFNNIQLNKL